MIPDYFEFVSKVEVKSGHRVLEEIPEILSALKVRKPLIITDSGVAAAGLLDLLFNALGSDYYSLPVQRETPPDSDLSVVSKTSEMYNREDCDSIIALGGGSVMDTAKGTNILVTEQAEDLRLFNGAGRLTKKLRPLIALPTTAGTGSEVTLVAVIADHLNKRKLLFTSPNLLPDAAILDSRMTLSLPPALTASTGMDALTHAVEAYLCLGKNPLSDSLALSAIKLISRHLLPVVKNPRDREGRLALAQAANLAGMAFSNSMVGMVHTLGHSVGGVCGVPHGTCMAILLPYGLEYNLHKIEVPLADLLLPLAGAEEYLKTPRENRARKVVTLIREMNESLYRETAGRHYRNLGEIKTREGGISIPREILPEIARTALGDGSVFYNPEEMDYADALRVLEAAWEGKTLL